MYFKYTFRDILILKVCDTEKQFKSVCFKYTLKPSKI